MVTLAGPGRRGRVVSTGAALLAVAALTASCGTGEDSPAAQGEVEPQATTTVTLDESAGEPFAVAQLRGPDGQALGTVEFVEADAGTRVSLDAVDLPPGFHGFHIHTTGLCEPDSENPADPGARGAFLSAGGHLKGDDDAVHPDHAGDLPPVYVSEDGTGSLITVTDRLDRETLFDDDGSAVMIHANSDNLANIPERYAPDGPDEDTKGAGDGGSRIACGVVEAG